MKLIEQLNIIEVNPENIVVQVNGIIVTKNNFGILDINN